MDRRLKRVKSALDAVRAQCDIPARRNADPVGIVHRFVEPADRELVALVAACVAFGNAKVIRAKVEDILRRVGPHPASVADDPEALRARLEGWRARVFIGDDVARLLAGGRAIQREYGSLGALFEVKLAEAELARGAARAAATSGQQVPEEGTDSDVLRAALGTWCDALRKAGGLQQGGRRRGPSHILPDPRGPSGSKRLLLLLRWMVRPADGIDFGMWNVPAARLLVPVDVHIHRLARNLGFTRRQGTSWQTTVEITKALARFDPGDPVSYDFALCHMGMLQRCPSRRDAALCEGCGVKPVCIHWERRAGAAPSPRPRPGQVSRA